MSGNREKLLESARLLCESFANKEPLANILEHFSNSPEVVCLEHGLPVLAPFLGRTFSGKDGAREYFTLIAELLSYKSMQFSDYIVDVESSVVSVRGKANFTWKSTNQSWDEEFMYRLLLDKEGKIVVYEVWADSGAAYLAGKGLL
mmetsp:Transcript_24464/g.37690  ORF Transcript_24464/g.37690 Transcript_24464/m.37690 type:complete len:146 (+) Transcript_24464:240-677(+)